ncbi:Protein of unknown function [Thermomonospora echinospora]|uniref:DUF2637 domain-containing protein n=1 Tax=Thermomonospora echinospora TaxID=1992 RepID=A0A1H6E0B1_9ACTN|nr:DUF2637 domain-containing protein [Thermomonospora echinospora]SEG90977.1 Protein of unknown function [Thermomonospora echinospora]
MTPFNSTPPPSFGALPGADHDAQARKLSGNEFTAVCVVAALVGALGLLGFINSFAAVMRAAEPSFGRLAWTVPVGIDLGIAIFAALDIVLARLDMRVRWLRFIVWALTAATVYLNVAGEDTVFGQVAHALLPCLWVAAVEIAAHVVKVRAGIAAGTRMDRIRASRWLLAPVRTAALWRRMVLWEVRSYPTALDRERARLLVLTDLQDNYGAVAWRWKAPRRVRALYRLGELAPAPSDAPTAGEPTALADTDRPAIEAGTPELADTPADTAPDNGADTAPNTMTDTAPDSTPDNGDRTVSAIKRSRPSARRTGGKSAKRSDRLADKARALLTANPDMTGAELGRRLKVSERTGARLRARVLTTTNPTHEPAAAAAGGDA